MPKEFDISIITPVYNTARSFLDDYWNSIVALTEKIKVEVIMVDDGSSLAETKDWITEHSKIDLLHIISFPHNKGISAARNVAIKEAKGRYFLAVDSDDYIHDPDALVSMYEKAVSKNCDMCFAPFRYRFDNVEEEVHVHINKKTLPYELEGVTCSSRLVKLDMIRSNNVNYPEGKLIEDPCFNLFSVMCSEQIEYYETSFITIRKHERSTSRQREVFQEMAEESIPMEYIERKLFDFSNIRNKDIIDAHEGMLINLLTAICCIFVNETDRRKVVIVSEKMIMRIKRPIYVSIKYLIYGKAGRTMKFIQVFFTISILIKCEYLFSKMVHRILTLKKQVA